MAIITFTLLTFGEIVPKVLFRSFADKLILKLIYPIRAIHFLLNPIIFIANSLSNFVLRVLNLRKESMSKLFSKHDVEVLLMEARESGTVDEDEHRIIRRVLALPETFVREAMIPRTMIHALPQTAGLTQVRNLIAKTGVSKVPIYRKNIDHIIGIVFIFDLFNNPATLKEVIKPVMFVPENKKCDQLLKEFRETNTTVAIVLDEYGGTAGLVTVSDLAEELFGELEEQTEGISSIRMLNKTSWAVDASTSMDVVNEQLGLNIPDGPYETLAGFILYRMGRIPRTGEKMVLQGFRTLITKATANRVEEVRIIRIPV